VVWAVHVHHVVLQSEITTVQQKSSPCVCLALALVGFAVAVPAQDPADGQQGETNVAQHVLPKQITISGDLSVAPPHYTTLRELVSSPRKFDGKLVQFRAWPAIGWEGDNYLFEQAYRPGMLDSGAPRVWFYESGPESRKLFESIDSLKESGGKFRGYFHYVPDSKSNGMFNPGRFQLDVKQVLKLR
jgi:hypothetical protein